MYVMDTCLLYPDWADKLMPITFFRSTPALKVPAVPDCLTNVPPPPRFIPHLPTGGGLTFTVLRPVAHISGCTWCSKPHTLVYSPKEYGVCSLTILPTGAGNFPCRTRSG